MDNSLEFVREEVLPEGVWICQVDDGTIFYWKYTSPKRLYVKRENNEISASLPDGTIYWKGAYGNAVYLRSENQIFRAEYTIANGIIISIIRAKLEGEDLHFGVLCTRLRDGKTYAYRMGEDPYRDGVQVNLTDQVLSGLELRLMHRGKLVFITKNSEVITPSVKKLKENVLLVEARYEYSLYARECSPFLYIAGGQIIYTLDTVTMEFLHPLHTGLELHSIAGVHNAVIIVDATEGDEQSIMVTALPEEYVVNTITVNGETMTIEALVGRYKDLEQLLKDVLEGHNGNAAKVDVNQQSEMENTIAAQRAQIAEFAQERKRILSTYQEMKAKLESSLEVQTNHADVTREKDEIKKSFDDYKTEMESLVRSLQLENCVRVREKELMETELTKSNIELRKENSALKEERERSLDGEHDIKKLTTLIEELQEKNIQLNDEINRMKRVKEDDSTKLVGDLRKIITELMQEKDRIRSLNADEDEVEEDEYINELRDVIANLTKEDRLHDHNEQDDLPPPPPSVLPPPLPSMPTYCRVSVHAMGTGLPQAVMSPVPSDPGASPTTPIRCQSLNPESIRAAPVTSTVSLSLSRLSTASDRGMNIAALIREAIPSRRAHHERDESGEEDTHSWDD